MLGVTRGTVLVGLILAIGVCLVRSAGISSGSRFHVYSGKSLVGGSLVTEHGVRTVFECPAELTRLVNGSVKVARTLEGGHPGLGYLCQIYDWAGFLVLEDDPLSKVVMATVSQEDAVDITPLATCTASSEYGPNFACAKAIDGDELHTSAWATNYGREGSWLELDLRGHYRVARVEVLSRCKTRDEFKDVDLVFDGNAKQEVSLECYINSNYGVCTDQVWQVFPVQTPTMTSSVRLEVKSLCDPGNPDSPGLRELRVYVFL